MKPISNEIKDFVEQQKLGFVATVSPDNTPNLSPKGTVVVWNDDQLIFANIKSPKTIANLKKNPNVEVNVVDPIIRRGYRFKGSATQFSEGEEYDKIISYYKKQGIKSEINEIVIIKIDYVEEVTSPLYDLGFSEEEIKERWKKHYLSF